MMHPHHRTVVQALGDAHRATVSLMGNQAVLEAIASAGSHMGAALRAGRTIYSCGNGGSMADAMHFAEELTGRYRKDRGPLAATAISDPTHLTCVANDYGFEHVFSRYIHGHAYAGDVLLAISTSGTSANVLRAIEAAHRCGMTVVGLSAAGFHGALHADDYDIATGPAGSTTDRVQELHIKVIHILVQLVERVALGVE